MCTNIHATIAAYQVHVLNTQNHKTLTMASTELSRLNKLSKATLLGWSSTRRNFPIRPYCDESIPIPVVAMVKVLLVNTNKEKTKQEDKVCKCAIQPSHFKCVKSLYIYATT